MEAEQNRGPKNNLTISEKMPQMQSRMTNPNSSETHIFPEKCT